MPWDDVLNHAGPFERFARSIQHGRLASTYLFVGPDGVGKHRFAVRLAQALLCERSSDPMQPCESCSACAQVKARTHPDLILVSKPPDKTTLPVELFIGDKEHRRQRGLVHDIGLKPFRGGRRIAIVDDVDFFNAEGANSLLKTLEEPPEHSLMILVGSSEQKQLSTILSRSQIVRFGSLTTEEVLQILGTMNLETDAPLDQVAAASGGSIARAVSLCEDGMFAFRQTLAKQIASTEPGGEQFGKHLLKYVDAAGKDANPRRDRMVLIGDLAIEFLQTVIAAAVADGQNAANSSLANQLANQLADRLRSAGRNNLQIASLCGDAIERTIQMQADIRANGMAANVVPPWLSDVGRMMHGELMLPSL